MANTKYLCVTVNTQPQDAIYDSVDLHRSLIVPLEPVDQNNDPVNLQTLTLQWRSTEPGAPLTAPSKKGDFLPAAGFRLINGHITRLF